MLSSDKTVYLFSIGWKQGDKELTDEEIQDACNAQYVAKQAAKQAVLDRLSITADEAALLLG
ncbi:MAG: hypothetical protein EBR82_64420 [Caulobacteraceae bacterium]|nr:hypothetical protein [Caulobacteraceae bacterium]